MALFRVAKHTAYKCTLSNAILLIYTTIAILLAPLAAAGSCCFTTATTAGPASGTSNIYSVAVNAIHSDIKRNGGVYRALFALPQTFRFTGPPTATAKTECTPGPTVPSVVCNITSTSAAENNNDRLLATMGITANEPLSGALPLTLTLFGDQCKQQQTTCSDSIVTGVDPGVGTEEGSSGDEMVNMGPFGTVSKPVAIGIGVGFGIILLGVAYAVLRRVFPGKQAGMGGGLRRADTVPLHPVANPDDKDDEQDSRGHGLAGAPSNVAPAYGAYQAPVTRGPPSNTTGQHANWSAHDNSNNNNNRSADSRRIMDEESAADTPPTAPLITMPQPIRKVEPAAIDATLVPAKRVAAAPMMTSVVVDLGTEKSATATSSPSASQPSSRAVSRHTSARRPSPQPTSTANDRPSLKRAATTSGSNAGGGHGARSAPPSRQPSTRATNTAGNGLSARSASSRAAAKPAAVRRSKSSAAVRANPHGEGRSARTMPTPSPAHSRKASASGREVDRSPGQYEQKSASTADKPPSRRPSSTQRSSRRRDEKDHVSDPRQQSSPTVVLSQEAEQQYYELEMSTRQRQANPRIEMSDFNLDFRLDISADDRKDPGHDYVMDQQSLPAPLQSSTAQPCTTAPTRLDMAGRPLHDEVDSPHTLVQNPYDYPVPTAFDSTTSLVDSAPDLANNQLTAENLALHLGMNGLHAEHRTFPAQPQFEKQGSVMEDDDKPVGWAIDKDKLRNAVEERDPDVSGMRLKETAPYQHRTLPAGTDSEDDLPLKVSITAPSSPTRHRASERAEGTARVHRAASATRDKKAHPRDKSTERSRSTSRRKREEPDQRHPSKERSKSRHRDPRAAGARKQADESSSRDISRKRSTHQQNGKAAVSAKLY